MTKDTGGPAFPAPAGVSHITEQGMSLRDYFAAAAMQGLLASEVNAPLNVFAEKAYALADVMLGARKL